MPRNISTTSLKWPSKELASPFQGLTRRLYPKTMDQVLAWAEELWLHHGLYSQAVKKAVRYFMTEVEIDSTDLAYETKEKYRETIKEDVDLLDDLALIGDDYIGFGNSFTSLHVPFIRSLVCPKCAGRAPLTKMWPHVRFSKFTFTGSCPFTGCTHKGEFTVKDTRVPRSGLKLLITRWPPQLISLEQHPISKKTNYYLNVDKYADLRDGIAQGNKLYIEETPWEIIIAVRDNKRLLFSEGSIYHVKNEPAAVSLAGLGGWGMPPYMSEFETAILVFLLDKYNEMILTDYLIPFRVITPSSRSNAKTNQNNGDVMMNLGLGDFVSKVKSMIARHRRNPTDWNFSPFPLEYQVLGGEAKNLTPVELMEHFEMRLLHSMGIPQEFYKGSFGDKAGPIIGFKMFERTWQHFTVEINKWLNWYIGKQSEMRGWEPVKATLIPVSLYEDPEIRMSVKELYAAGKVSESTYFRMISLDSVYEQKHILEEQDQVEKNMQKRMIKSEKDAINLQALQSPPAGQPILEQQQMEQQGGAMPPGGGGTPMPPAGGGVGGGSMMPGGGTLDELMVQAEQIANEIVGMEASMRKSRLIELKKTNEAMHAQVTSIIKTIEQQNAQQGVQMGRQGQMPQG